MKKIKLKLIITIVLIMIYRISCINAQMVYNTYDFNSLNLANLNGQDGWTTVLNQGGVNDFVVSYTPSAPDLTKCIMYSQSGGNFGRTASRISTTALPFDFSNGGVIEIQVQCNPAHWGTFFGFGYDKNGNGYIVPGIEQIVNYETDEGGIGLYLSHNLPGLCSFMKPDGSKINITSFSFPDGWYNIKFLIDLDANNSAGRISMFACQSGGSWSTITEVSNLDLGLTPSSGDKKDPATWTKLFCQSTGGEGAFDNIKIGQPNVPPGMLYQYITFDAIPDHLTTDAPFHITASSSRGLPVSFAVASGPATLIGDTVTLTGAGRVFIVASQGGNDTIAPATNDTVSFYVIDPLSVIPTIEIRNPYDITQQVLSPNLDGIVLWAKTTIEHEDLLHVNNVTYTVNGTNITGIPTSNGNYICYWQPPSAGTFTISAVASTSGGASASTNSTNFQVSTTAPSQNITILNNRNLYNDVNNTLDTTLILPSFSGTYSKIVAQISYIGINEPWDRVTNFYIKGANGTWVELLRYMTPYAKNCGDTVDITDFASQLQGKVDFRAVSNANGPITITLLFTEGTPTYKYSWMDPLWNASYSFGKMNNLQPVPIKNLIFNNTSVLSTHLRLVSTGHNGPNNTNNAAEFSNNTHHIKINGTTVYNQNLWCNCNPNPSSPIPCNNQSGTWTYARAGWCPGSIPMTFNYDLTPYINFTTPPQLQYEFDPNYVDLCSPFNPNCTPSVCSACSDQLNPLIIVAGELVTFCNEITYNVKEMYADNNITLFPNPNNGQFTLQINDLSNYKGVQLRIVDFLGKTIVQQNIVNEITAIDIRKFAQGIYYAEIISDKGKKVLKVISGTGK